MIFNKFVFFFLNMLTYFKFFIITSHEIHNVYVPRANLLPEMSGPWKTSSLKFWLISLLLGVVSPFSGTKTRNRFHFGKTTTNGSESVTKLNAQSETVPRNRAMKLIFLCAVFGRCHALGLPNRYTRNQVDKDLGKLISLENFFNFILIPI